MGGGSHGPGVLRRLSEAFDDTMAVDQAITGLLAVTAAAVSAWLLLVVASSAPTPLAPQPQAQHMAARQPAGEGEGGGDAGGTAR